MYHIIAIITKIISYSIHAIHAIGLYLEIKPEINIVNGNIVNGNIDLDLDEEVIHQISHEIINQRCSKCYIEECPHLFVPLKESNERYAKLFYSESFDNFEQKILSNIWNYLSLQDPLNPLNMITISDGKIIQECNSIVLDSSIFSVPRPHPITNYHMALIKNFPYDKNFKGIAIEFTVHQDSQYISKVFESQFADQYESTNVDPFEDLRLANSSVGFQSSSGDQPFVEVVIAGNIIYLVYGIRTNTTLSRDRFTAAIPVLRKINDVAITFSLNLHYDGSVQLFVKDHNNSFFSLKYVSNIGIPPIDHQMIIKTYSLNTTTFIEYPVSLNESSINITLKNGSMMDAIWNSSATLYSVNGDLTNQIYKYPNKCDSTITPTISTIILPDATIGSTSSLLFGQGSKLKISQLCSYYI